MTWIWLIAISICQLAEAWLFSRNLDDLDRRLAKLENSKEQTL